MISKYLTAALSSVVMTFAILYGMQALIAMQPGAETDVHAPRLPIFVRTLFDEPVEPLEPPRPEPIDKVEPPPARAPNIGDVDAGPIKVPRPPAPGPRTPNRGFDLPPTDGPLVAMFRAQPNYPTRAAQQGLGGYVDVQFDVTANGQTANAIVLRASHTIFESAALEATNRLRYKPRVVAGVAVATAGIRYRFTFKMEN